MKCNSFFLLFRIFFELFFAEFCILFSCSRETPQMSEMLVLILSNGMSFADLAAVIEVCCVC